MISNFAWVVSWKITHRCNLRCVYCNPKEIAPVSHSEAGDPEEIIRKIAGFRPKYLNITGGEPTLVESLHRVLKFARENWNPSTYVVHNGSAPDKLVPLLPYLDRFVISLDGPGEKNRETKGLDGDRVLTRLQKIVPDARAADVDMSINCVLTRDMLPHMRELAMLVRDRTPEVTLCFSTLVPPLSPDSILSNPADLDTFQREYRRLREEKFNVVQTVDHMLSHPDYQRVQCYNQFFTLRVNPEGKISSCAMNVPIHAKEYAQKWKKLFTRDGIQRARDMAKKFVNNRVRSTIDFTCTTVCHCETWLDLLFLNRTTDATPIYLKGLVGRVSEKELQEMSEFVRSNINSSFDLDLFRHEMGKSGSYRSVKKRAE